MAKGSNSKKSKPLNRPHPMPRKPGLGKGRGYGKGGKLCK